MLGAGMEDMKMASEVCLFQCVVHSGRMLEKLDAEGGTG